jgi:hypothetical protein
MYHRLGNLRHVARSLLRGATEYFLSRNYGNVVELSDTVKDSDNRQKARCERQGNPEMPSSVRFPSFVRHGCAQIFLEGSISKLGLELPGNLAITFCFISRQ